LMDGYKANTVERWRRPKTSEYICTMYTALTLTTLVIWRSPRRSCSIETPSSAPHHATSHTELQ
ncbi:hypothetical protein DM02DRAFT_546883, partial [Periconia macrospinosa]